MSVFTTGFIVALSTCMINEGNTERMAQHFQYQIYILHIE